MGTNEIIIVLVAGAVGTIIKSITGMGYPLVLVTTLALFIDVSDAVLIVAPSNLLLNLRLTWSTRHEQANATTFPRFVKWGVVGSIVGALALPGLPDNVLRIVVVFVIALFLFTKLRMSSFVLSDAQGQRFAPLVGGVAGVFQGASSIAGPILTPWFMSLGLSRDAYLFAVTATFSITGIVQIVVLASQQLFTGRLLLLGFMLVPVAVALYPVGVAIRNRVSIVTFERIVLALLALSAVSLIVKMF